LFYNRNYNNLLSFHNNHYNVWNYIIKCVLVSTIDFNYARLIKSNHYELINFYNKYKELKPKKFDFKLSKSEKKELKLKYEFNEFGESFNDKNLLLKIIKIYYEGFKPENTILIKNVSNEKIKLMYLLISQLDQLNIQHLDIHEEYIKKKRNIRFKKYEYEYIDINNISSDIIIFLIVNNLCNYYNLIINDSMIVLNVYYEINMKNDDYDVFDNYVLMNNLIKILRKRNIKNVFDYYNPDNLNENQVKTMKKLNFLINN
jgi:hypothetical protein